MLSQNAAVFFPSIKVTDMTGHSSETNKLGNINTIGCTSQSRNGKFTISKSKSSRLSKNLVLTNPSDIDQCKSKDEASVSETLALFN